MPLNPGRGYSPGTAEPQLGILPVREQGPQDGFVQARMALIFFDLR